MNNHIECKCNILESRGLPIFKWKYYLGRKSYAGFVMKYDLSVIF